MRREELRNTADKLNSQGNVIRQVVVSEDTFRRLVREHMSCEFYLKSWFGGKKGI